jgi:hypothetical protein
MPIISSQSPRAAGVSLIWTTKPTGESAPSKQSKKHATLGALRVEKDPNASSG